MPASGSEGRSQRIFRNLSDRCPVRTLHVVGVDFQLRLWYRSAHRLESRSVAIRLLGIGLLRVLVDDNAAVKYPMRTSVENAVVKLPAVAVRTMVLHKHVIVQMLPAVSNKQTIDQALAAFACKHRMHVVAHQAATQEQRMRGNIGAAGLLVLIRSVETL